MSMLMDGGASATTYEWVSVIGTGAYGTVYKARDSSGQTVAIKKIRIASSEEGMPMSMIREVAMLRQLENYEHENIVRLKDVFTAMKNTNELRLMLVFEYVEQDLALYLERCPSPGLGPDRIRDLMRQMLTGIDFLHTLRIVHRDLKPQNVLITNSGRLKLADFGLSRIYAFTMALTSVVVTLWYRSPEVLLQETYCTAVDLWSAGCIFAELFSRKPLFCGQSEVDQLCKIFEITGLPAESDWPQNAAVPRNSFSTQYRKRPWSSVIRDIDPAASDLIERLLSFDQRKRICAQDALRHDYFRDDVIQQPSFNESQPISQTVVTSAASANNTTNHAHASTVPAHLASHEYALAYQSYPVVNVTSHPQQSASAAATSHMLMTSSEPSSMTSSQESSASSLSQAMMMTSQGSSSQQSYNSLSSDNGGEDGRG